MRKLRVAYDVRQLAASDKPTGVGQYALGLIEAMIPLADVELFSDRPWDPPTGLGGAEMNVLPRAPYWQQSVLPLSLARREVDLYHSLMYTLPLWLPTPCVVTIHDLGFAVAPETLDPGVLRYLNRMVPLAVRRASRIIVPSAAVEDDLLKVYPHANGKVVVVHHGLAETFRGTTGKHIGPHPYLLAVGTQEPRKNLARLVHAFAILLSERPSLSHRLVLIGSLGEDTHRIEDVAKRLGVLERIEFLGYVRQDRIPEYFRGADVFIYPSLFEGFGMPILEAMASGCPVVTSRTPAMPEVAGDAAVFVDPTDASDIALGILRALEDADRLRRKGRARAELFSWSNAAAETHRVYQDALGTHLGQG